MLTNLASKVSLPSRLNAVFLFFLCMQHTTGTLNSIKPLLIRKSEPLTTVYILHTHAELMAYTSSQVCLTV